MPFLDGRSSIAHREVKQLKELLYPERKGKKDGGNLP